MSCCCSRIDFFGRCYAVNGTSIAHCTTLLNETVASCQGVDNQAITFECYTDLSYCPLTSLEESDRVFGFVPILTLGIVLSFFSWFIYPCFLRDIIHKHCCQDGDSKQLDQEEKEKLFDTESAPNDVSNDVSNDRRPRRSILCCVPNGTTPRQRILCCRRRNGERIAVVIGTLVGSFIIGISIRHFFFFKFISKGDQYESSANVTAKDVYGDMVGSSVAKVFLTFSCQFILLSMYFVDLMSNGRPDFSYVSTYAFYFLGAFIQYIFIAKDTGIGIVNDFFREMEFWEKTLECVQHDKYLYCDLANEEYKENQGHDLVFKKRIHFIFILSRMTLSLLVNQVGKFLINTLLPIHLAHSESSMDFVLNAVAAYFIIEVDNLTEDREIEFLYQERRKKKKDPDLFAELFSKQKRIDSDNSQDEEEKDRPPDGFAESAKSNFSTLLEGSNHSNSSIESDIEEQKNHKVKDGDKKHELVFYL